MYVNLENSRNTIPWFCVMIYRPTRYTWTTVDLRIGPIGFFFQLCKGKRAVLPVR
jgi:hypothetical protein